MNNKEDKKWILDEGISKSRYKIEKPTIRR